MKRLIFFAGMLLSACTQPPDPPASVDSVAESLPPPSQPAAWPRPSEPSLVVIAAAADRLQPQLVALRRDIHMHPELSGQEARTARLVATALRRLGLEVRTGVGGHGVVGILRTHRPGPVVGFRADMDAMPMQEPPGRPYGSTVPGVFHICGHDLHTAIGVGVATTLSAMRPHLRGTAVFYFQPAEETLAGARAMIDDGALADPRPDVLYAVHSWSYPVGEMAHPTAFAGRDRFLLHPPPAAADALLTALAPLNTVAFPTSPAQIAQILLDLQTPDGPLSTSVFLRAGFDPASGALTGTVKAADDAMYASLRHTIRQAIDGVIGPAANDLTFPEPTFPAMRPDPRVDADAAPILARSIGAGRLRTLHATWPLNGEDFALFQQQVPGAMFLLGVANPARGISGVPHSPDFDADEEAIRVGTRTMTAVLVHRLWQ
jgi:metal-dependent amidase/aminoacylase/carboxypeptidase family protein